MKMKRDRRINVMLVILTLILAIIPIASASASSGFSSQGKLVFTNGTSGTEDDVIFDAEDFQRLADVCR